MQYIIYMDESSIEGPYFGNFYGGALVRSVHYQSVTESLNLRKEELGLGKEVKWQRVTMQYEEKYIKLMETFFDFIEKDIVNMRVMFTHNYRQATNLTQEQRSKEYSLLYYQFFKHAFGLKHCNPNTHQKIGLRLYFDELPISPSNKVAFKNYIEMLAFSDEFRYANIQIKPEDITEVKSDQHVILQCMDIVLGSMYFRLNDFHKAIPKGLKRRGKRTIAKEKVYKYINKRIRTIYPNFNIGSSTGTGKIEDRWEHPYRHWLFVPNEHKVAPEYAKK